MSRDRFHPFEFNGIQGERNLRSSGRSYLLNEEMAIHTLIEIRHLVAVAMLAEELNFTRAAKRLKLSQSGLSRRLIELEHRCHLKLFNRDHATVGLTDAGRAFVEEANLALLHHERATQYAKAANEGIESRLAVGHSPYVDPVMVSTMLAIHLPLHPSLVLHIQSDYSPDLVHGLLTSKLDLAVIAHPGANLQLTTTRISEDPFYIALQEDHPLAAKETLTLNDLRDIPWILFDRKVHPAQYDSILRRAVEEEIMVKSNQTVLTADEALQSVAEDMGVTFLTMTTALLNVRPGIAVRPLIDKELCVEVCLASRAENRSKLVSEFARAFMKRISQALKPTQMTLPMTV
jgi:DNA-binding transcriptional LysR family regulator